MEPENQTPYNPEPVEGQATNQPINQPAVPPPQPQPPAPEPMPEILPAAAATEQPPAGIVHEIPKKRNGFVLFLIILLILVSLGSLGYWAYQNYFAVSTVASPQPSAAAIVPTATPDVTANWKTYTNPQFNYSFRYPPDENVNGKYGQNSVSLGGRKINDPLYAPMIFTVFDNGKDLSIREWFMVHAPNDKVTENLFQDVLVAGNPVVKFISKGGPVYSYFIKGSKIIISADPMDSQTNADVQNKENDQILSTFKFTTPQCKTGEYLKQCKLGPCCCPVGSICD